jgi:hypothetical protein
MARSWAASSNFGTSSRYRESGDRASGLFTIRDAVQRTTRKERKTHMFQLKFFVTHGSNPRTQHGTLHMTPSATSPTTTGTFRAHTAQSGIQPTPTTSWTYNIDTNSQITATLTPNLQLTDSGDAAKPPILYSGFSGTVSTVDSTGQFNSVSSGTMAIDSTAGGPADGADSWDASASSAGDEDKHLYATKA